jgi:hypothetical protein
MWRGLAVRDTREVARNCFLQHHAHRRFCKIHFRCTPARYRQVLFRFLFDFGRVAMDQVQLHSNALETAT